MRSGLPRSHYPPCAGRAQSTNAANAPKWTFNPCLARFAHIDGRFRACFPSHLRRPRCAAPSRMSRSETSIASRPNSAHRLDQDDAARDDRGRAVGMQARDLAPLGERHARPARPRIRSQRRERQAVAVDALAVVGVEAQVDRRERRRRAGDRDALRTALARRRRRNRAFELRARTAAAAPPARRGVGRVGLQVALGVAHRADLRRDEELDLVARARRPARCCRRRCRAPAAARPCRRPAGGAQVGQPRLALAGDRLRLEAEALAQLALELGAVGGVAHRARQHRDHALGAERGRSPRGSRRRSRARARSPRRAGARLRSTPSPSRVTSVRRSSSSTPAARRPPRPAAASSWCRCRRLRSGSQSY